MSKLYFKDNTLFADSYERVVYGAKGNYIELTRDQIKVTLTSFFNQVVPEELSDESFSHYWLKPEGRSEKIYWQIHEVNYADYKRDRYYISVMLVTFEEELNFINNKEQ